jgi:hypothetical protein
MQTITVNCPLADRPVTLVREATPQDPKPVAICLAPCTGRHCPPHVRPTSH